MITLTPCSPPPLNASGIAVKALYFQQTPGEKFISVFARYDNGEAWVPLHIGLPAVPGLQQVRDMDRNILMNSGSFEDAHLYLRSAAGNNTTVAFYANELGGGIQVGNVDGKTPLNLQADGGRLNYGTEEVATRNWTTSQGYLQEETDPTVPDWVKAITSQQIQHWDGSLTKKQVAVTDFNAVSSAGLYKVNGNLRSIANYPNLNGNNNMADSGYLLVYELNERVVQLFYPLNGYMYNNQGAGHWYRNNYNQWEYRDGVLQIDLYLADRAIHADNLLYSGVYMINIDAAAELAAYGYPANTVKLPLMVTVKTFYGNNSQNWSVTQEAVALQESMYNKTQQWLRSCFRWTTGRVFDAWHEIAFAENFYTKNQLSTAGSGAQVAWSNIVNAPPLIGLTALSANGPLAYNNSNGVFSISPATAAADGYLSRADWTTFNNKQAALGFTPENAANKTTAISLGSSDTLFPSQRAVKTYVDNKVQTNNSGYIAITQKGVANGVATLGADGKVPNSQIPALAITDTFTVASEVAMLALNAETGDVAVRSDQNRSYILQAAPASTIANWVELQSPTVTNSDQVPEGTTNLYFSNARSRNAISVNAPLLYDSGTGAISLLQAGSGSNGYLTADDWNLFNGKEPAFAKNAAFNKNFGTAAGSVAEGNDSRIINGQAAYTWGNHAGLYLPTGSNYTNADVFSLNIAGKNEGAGGYPETYGSLLSFGGGPWTTQFNGATGDDRVFFRNNTHNGPATWATLASREWILGQGYLTAESDPAYTAGGTRRASGSGTNTMTFSLTMDAKLPDALPRGLTNESVTNGAIGLGAPWNGQQRFNLLSLNNHGTSMGGTSDLGGTGSNTRLATQIATAGGYMLLRARATNEATNAWEPWKVMMNTTDNPYVAESAASSLSFNDLALQRSQFTTLITNVDAPYAPSGLNNFWAVQQLLGGDGSGQYAFQLAAELGNDNQSGFGKLSFRQKNWQGTGAWYQLATTDKAWGGTDNSKSNLTTDFNQPLLPSGSYNGANPTGAPAAGWSNMLNIRHNNNTSGYGNQIAFGDFTETIGGNVNHMYWRWYNNNAFSPWRKVWTDHDFDPAGFTGQVRAANGAWGGKHTFYQQDNSNSNFTANDYGVGAVSGGMWNEFKLASVVGLPANASNYATVHTMSQWNNTGGGGGVHQLAYNDNKGMYWRWAEMGAGSWPYAWQKIMMEADVIQNQNTAPQAAAFWINSLQSRMGANPGTQAAILNIGNTTEDGYPFVGKVVNITGNVGISGNLNVTSHSRAAQFLSNANGYALNANSGYWGFYTEASNAVAAPAKMGSLTISSAYSDAAPANGLFSLGNVVVGKTGSIGTNTPTSIMMDNSYTMSPAFDRLKFYLYKPTPNDAYGFTVGANSDLQYWAGPLNGTGQHRFFIGHQERVRMSATGITLDVIALDSVSDPVMRIGNPGIAGAYATKLENSLGGIQTFITASAGQFVNNSIAGDGGFRLTGGAKMHFGVGTGNATLSLSSSTVTIPGLSGGGSRMVITDNAGNVSAMPIPPAGGGSWWDYEPNYPTGNWIYPGNAGNGVPDGIVTKGLSTNGRIENATYCTIEEDDHTIIFQAGVTIEMPDPASYPGRQLRLRNRAGLTMTFNGYEVYDINPSMQITSFPGNPDCFQSVCTHGNTLEVQSIADNSGAYSWYVIAATS